MQLLPKFMNLLMRRNSVTSPLQYLCFHSTPVSLGKWKNKWNRDSGRGQHPPKNYIRYTIREKRADAKRALKDLLFSSSGWRASCRTFEDGGIIGDDNRNDSRNFEPNHNQPQSGRFRRGARNSSHGGRKRKKRSECYSDYDVDPSSIFQEKFGGRCFTWSYRSWDGSDVHCSSFDFDWRDDNSDWARNKRVVWNTSSEEETNSEDDDVKEELHTVSSSLNRTLLGLPPKGPLKIDDIKNAFRSCALKWHPDKHQGPSQAVAAEKFKQCSEAYQFLCKELASA